MKQISNNIYINLIKRLAIVMLLFTISRIGFFVINHDLYREVTVSGLFKMLLGGLKFDWSAVLYINSLFIVLQILPHPFKLKKGYQIFCKWLFIISNSIALTINSMDTIYYRFTLKRSTVVTFDFLAGENNIISILAHAILDYWYVSVFGLGLIFVLIKVANKIKDTNQFSANKWIHYTLSTMLMIFFVGITIAGMRGGFRHSTRPIAMSNAGVYVEQPNQTSIVLNTPFCILRTLNRKGLKELKYYNSDELVKRFNPVKIPIKKPFKKLNVVILVLESFGREYLGVFNKIEEDSTYKGYTPFLDSLILESKSYQYSLANGRKSIDALPSLVTGIPSFYYPFILSPYTNNTFNSIAGLLKYKGYQSSFFHGGYNGTMGFDSFMNLAKFDKYYGLDEFNDNSKSDGTWGIWDEDFLHFFATTLNQQKQPFVSTVFTLSSHHPFVIPEKYKDKFAEGTLPIHKTVRYTDFSLQQFFKTASKMDWYNNTLFVISADHASTPYLESYKNIMGGFQIPLLFFQPNSNLKGMEQQLAQQIDIMPTVLNYLGYEKPYYAMGNDLLDSTSNKFVVNYYNGAQMFVFWQGDYMIYHSLEGKLLGLYNYKNDKAARYNLLAKSPKIATKMDELLKAIIQTYNHDMITDRLVVE